MKNIIFRGKELLRNLYLYKDTKLSGSVGLTCNVYTVRITINIKKLPTCSTDGGNQDMQPGAGLFIIIWILFCCGSSPGAYVGA
jgi:hypothetical protein